MLEISHFRTLLNQSCGIAWTVFEIHVSTSKTLRILCRHLVCWFSLKWMNGWAMNTSETASFYGSADTGVTIATRQYCSDVLNLVRISAALILREIICILFSDMGKCHLTKGKQALEIRSSLSEKRALTDPIQQIVSSAESLARNLQWAKAHGIVQSTFRWSYLHNQKNKRMYLIISSLWIVVLKGNGK